MRSITSSNTKSSLSLSYVFCICSWSEKFDKIYVGLSNDPDRRLKEHNTGKSIYTKKYMPWHRFYLEEVIDIKQARSKEKYLKSG